MNFKRTYKIITAALFSALICCLNLIIHIPIPGGLGYVNIGDTMIIIAGIFAGPFYGAAAAAIGGILSDIINGFTVYIPVTAAAKALTAILSYYIFTKLKYSVRVNYIISAITAELPSVILYSLYDCLIAKDIKIISISLPYNIIQGIISAVIAIIILTGINKTNLSERLKKYENL